MAPRWSCFYPLKLINRWRTCCSLARSLFLLVVVKWRTVPCHLPHWVLCVCVHMTSANLTQIDFPSYFVPLFLMAVAWIIIWGNQQADSRHWATNKRWKGQISSLSQVLTWSNNQAADRKWNWSKQIIKSSFSSSFLSFLRTAPYYAFKSCIYYPSELTDFSEVSLL